MDIGPFKKSRMEFKDTNVIVGANGSGKTTLLRLINLILVNREIYEDRIVNDQSDRGTVKIELLEEMKSIELSLERGKPLKHECLLIDDPFSRLDPKRSASFLSYLKKIPAQIIMTCYGIEQLDLKGINVIKL